MHAQRRPKVSHAKRWVVGGASLLVLAAGAVGFWQTGQGQDPSMSAATSPTAEVGEESMSADDAQPVSLNGLPAGADGVSNVPVGSGIEPSAEEISTMLSLDETATDGLSDADEEALAAAAEDGAPLPEDVAEAEVELDEAIAAAEASTPDPGAPTEWDSGIVTDAGAVTLDDLDEEADQLTDRLESWLPDASEGDR